MGQVETRRREVVDALNVQVVDLSDATFEFLLNDASVDVVRYPYAPLGRTTAGPEGARIACLRDLAVMKLAAIAKRGVRRDYWDLHEIRARTRLTLHSSCDDYLRKYGATPPAR